MSGLMNIDVLMNFVCSASVLSENLSSRPDVCVPTDGHFSASPRTISSVSELCLTPECNKEGSGEATDLSVNIHQLASLLNISSDSDYCTTPGCTTTAATILSNLDDKVNPCDDFYQFACGGYINRHIHHKNEFSVFSTAQHDIDLKLKSTGTRLDLASQNDCLIYTLDNGKLSAPADENWIIIQDATSLEDLLEKELREEELDYIIMIKKVYNSCMDEEGLKAAGNRPLRAILKHLGGWPVILVRRWNSAKFDWIDTLIKIRNLGYNHDIFMSLSVKMDNQNNKANIIQLGKPSFGMDGRYLLRGVTDKSVRDYVLSMEKSADELSAYNLPKSPIYKAFEFEVTLANISLQNEKENVSSINRKYTVKDLKALVPQINWDKYFKGLLSDEISDNDIVLVEDLTFIKNAAHFISRTNKRILANYMIWRVVDQSLPLMSKKWRSLKHSPRHSIEMKRWEVCLSFIRDNLGIALSSFYVRNYVKEENYDTVQEYVDYIRENFVRILENTEWMDDDTKEIAKAKVKSITSHIGYAKELLNASYISDLYKNLNIDSSGYFHIRRKIFKWSTDYSFSLLRKPNIKRRWNKHSRTTIVQAFYDERQNSIGIPTGVLHAPIFYNNRPQYLNFGPLGYIIGHEITHAFDNRGRKFDKDGNSRNWWSTTEERAFNSRAECFIEQYDNYTAENGMQVKGMNTQDENVADITALKVAYLAYQSWVKDKKMEQKLPGLDYTANQLFWIQAANIWCETLKPETLRNIIADAPYSPSKFRVIGPMSNLPEFAIDFQCNATSAMVRKTRCQVW